MTDESIAVAHLNPEGSPDAILVGFASEESAEAYLRRLIERTGYDLDHFSIRAWTPAQISQDFGGAL